MKIILVQSQIKSDRPADNLDNIKAALNMATDRKADLVIFPRLALSGRLGPEALERPGLDSQYQKIWNDFLTLSQKYSSLMVGSSVLRFDGGGSAQEEAFVVHNGQDIYRQPKIMGTHLEPPSEWPSLSRNGEQVRLLVGDDGLLPGADQGVKVVISLKNFIFQGQPFKPSSCGSSAAWRLNVAAIGGDGPYIYEGATTVIAPDGRLKGWAHGFEKTIMAFDTQAKELPTITPPAREPAAVMYEALKTGLRDFVKQSGIEKVLLGLSGGMDSALVATLAADALGPENVLGVGMPSEFNAPESLTLARDLSKNLGISFLTMPINSIKNAFANSFLLIPKADEKAAGLADENIQARIRSVLLMYISNRENRLLLATANKSEAAMGYSTLYGDTCGAIAPLGDVYKMTVYELARHINREREIIPQGIIDRVPSAELRPGQRDDDSLPPYEILDDILARFLEGRQRGAQIAKEGGHSALTVASVLSSVKKMAYKRAQEPFSLIASSRPLRGNDWQMKTGP